MAGWDAAWQPVECAGCHRRYRCTPNDDYYESTGPADGLCLGCLMIRAGLDPETTPVTVLGPDLAEIDPRER